MRSVGGVLAVIVVLGLAACAVARPVDRIDVALEGDEYANGVDGLGTDPAGAIGDDSNANANANTNNAAADNADAVDSGLLLLQQEEAAEQAEVEAVLEAELAQPALTADDTTDVEEGDEDEDGDEEDQDQDAAGEAVGESDEDDDDDIEKSQGDEPRPEDGTVLVLITDGDESMLAVVSVSDAEPQAEAAEQQQQQEPESLQEIVDLLNAYDEDGEDKQLEEQQQQQEQQSDEEALRLADIEAVAQAAVAQVSDDESVLVIVNLDLPQDDAQPAADGGLSEEDLRVLANADFTQGPLMARDPDANTNTNADANANAGVAAPAQPEDSKVPLSRHALQRLSPSVRDRIVQAQLAR